MAGSIRFRFHSLRFLPLPILSVLILAVLFPPGAASQERAASSASELAEVAADLRAHYYDRSWELGCLLGEEWNASAPDALELRAWYAMNLSRDRRVPDAIEVAEELMGRAPESRWAWFALAGALLRDSERYKEALEPSGRALELDPDNPDFLSLRADAIRLVEGAEEAIAWVDALPSEQGGHPLVLIRKAVALHGLSGTNEDPEMEEAAFALFREVMELDPTFVEAPFFLGSRLQTAVRLDEAIPLLERSARLSRSYQVHEYYWRGIQARRDMETAEKRALIQADIRSLLAGGGETPGALMAVARTYEEWEETEKRDEIYSRVLAEFPETQSAEWVLVNQYREMQTALYEQERETGEQDPDLRARYRRKLEEFLMRPEHNQERLRGDAYRNLMGLLAEDEDVDPEYLYSIIRGVELYEGINIHLIYARAPIILADHGSHLDYAERLALKGFDAAAEQMEEYRERGIYDSEEDAQRSADNFRAIMLDALGWVHFHQGRIDDAEGKLLEARQLTETNPTVLLHLGKLYERRAAQAAADGEDEGARGAYLDQAQDFYLKGSLVPSPGKNPNDGALQDLYLERHGNLDGYEAFLTAASSVDATDRKTEILAARLDEPRPLEPFAMEDLTGEVVSSEALAGKVVVINFWGTWCGPCIIEMPEIQAFYDRYRDDDGVAVLTLANDQNPDLVHRFMAEKDYSFPVLLDDGYVKQVRIRAFPTTWFIGPDGSIWFEKRGWSEELAQEFAWRVEALRSGS